MSTNERVRGVHVHRPIIYGSVARLLSPEERALAPPDHTHRWTIFVTSAAPKPGAMVQASSNEPPPLDHMPGGGDDLSYLIRKVTFKLHETIPNPTRIIDKPPFEVTETGWGEFAVPIRIQFVPEAAEKPINITHNIRLHHWGPPIETIPAPVPAPAPIADTTGTTSGEGPAEVKEGADSTTGPAEEQGGMDIDGKGASEAGGKEDVEKKGDQGGDKPGEGGSVPEPGQGGDVEMEDASGPTSSSDKPADTASEAADPPIPPAPITSTDPTAPPSAAGAPSIDTPAAPPTGAGSAVPTPSAAPTPSASGTDSAPTAAPPPAPAPTLVPVIPLSIATRYPVHAWQYDEIVLSDPFQSLLTIMNAHTPTPLPARIRKVRDQREDWEGEKRRKKGGSAAATAAAKGSSSRTRAAGAGTGADESDKSLDPTSILAISEKDRLGIPGEPGSADVPLEYTAEMEKAEWNRLNDARIRIIEEMDRWREKLIEREKEVEILRKEVGRERV